MSNDRDVIQAWLAEQFASVEQDGAVSIIGLSHVNAAGQEVPLHAMSAKGGGRWGDHAAMAEVFSSVAERHARGIASAGGSQQFALAACFGASAKPTRFLPFSRQGQQLAAPGLSSEPATATGALAQGMRLGELLIQGSFKQNEVNAANAQVMLNRSMTRQAELESDNRELFAALKLVILEFTKSAHEMRMKELAAARAAAFQKRVMDLAPTLINLAFGDVLPDSVEEQGIVDAIGGSFSQTEAEAIVAGLAAKPRGEMLAAALHRKLKAFYAKQATEKAQDEKLLRDVPLASFAEAAEDAANRAVRVVRDQAKQLANGHANGTNGTNGTNGHIVVEAPDVVESKSARLKRLLFAAVPSREDLDGLVGMLRLKGANELADELTDQYDEASDPEGEKK